ncbi:MAG: DNA primase [Sandaracinaceae bacterium]
MIPEEKVAEIRERTDIKALVGEYVQLKRSGTSFKGLCPFHSEKSPSFYVHPDRGFFHCFGCQASGDAISFLMRIDGTAFPDALSQLAERAGVEIVNLDSAEEQVARRRRQEKERLLSIVEAAAGFFVKMLAEHRFGPMAWDELRRRELGEDAVSRYRLGYAPHGWDELGGFLRDRGFSPNDCERVGLVVPRRQREGYYDRFRHRLMFPVSDAHGRIVAFSGRALPDVEDRGEHDPPAKYINSPETPLYTKGQLLFGLHEARVGLRRSEVALMCEGNFDVVSLSHHGFANVVAPLGTALTATQCKLLRRFASTCVLLFDSDKAGRKAVRAAQPLLAQAGIAGKVVTLPPGDDPDSFLRSQGADGMRQLIEGAPSLIQWLIDQAATEAGADPRAKAEGIEALGPVLASLDNPVEARLYVEVVAHAFEVPDVGVVRQQLRRGALAARGKRPRRRRGEAPAAPEAAREAPVRRRPLVENEAKLVAAFVDQPGVHASVDVEKVQELLTSDGLRAILSATARWAGARSVDGSALLEVVEDGSPEREWLIRRLAVQEFEDETSAQVFVERCSAVLAKKHVERETRRLGREIIAARRAGDNARADALSRQVTELRKKSRPATDTQGAGLGTKR